MNSSTQMLDSDPLAIVARAACTSAGYELVSSIGAGSFKRAFLARAMSGQHVAVKVAPWAAGGPRLLREWEAMSGCSHASIAKQIGASETGEGQGKCFVFFEEYLAGGTLEDNAGAYLASTASVQHAALHLGDALGHLEERRLVHRDIKPANVMFRDHGTNVPVLTDFGIVRVLNASTLTQEFLQMGPGTPRYAAPEQLNNEKAQIDWRTDQFGLGVMLGECALGYHPFDSGAGINAAIGTVAARMPLPERGRADLQAMQLDSIVKAISPWSIHRYRRPEDLLAAIRGD